MSFVNHLYLLMKFEVKSDNIYYDCLFWVFLFRDYLVPVDPMETMDPQDPVDLMDPKDPVDPVEKVDHLDHQDPQDLPDPQDHQDKSSLHTESDTHPSSLAARDKAEALLMVML